MLAGFLNHQQWFEGPTKKVPLRFGQVGVLVKMLDLFSEWKWSEFDVFKRRKREIPPKKNISQKGHFWLVGRTISCDFALLELQRTSCNYMKVWFIIHFFFQRFWIIQLKQPFTRWWFQKLFIFTPFGGRFPFWRAYFSIGLKSPPNS